MASGNKSYKHLSATATAVLSPNPSAILGSVIINTASTGTGGTLQLWDGLTQSAPSVLIAAINLANPNVPGFDYNIIAAQGLSFVFVQGGTTAGDITITFQ